MSYHDLVFQCSGPGALLTRETEAETMKITNVRALIVTVGLVVGGLTACVTEKEQAAKLESQATVTRAEAEKIALAKVPGGTIKEGELEKEKGKVIWSFDIATAGSKDVTEVQVDAKTGAVVSVEKETPADQAKETKEKK
jgi:uncharacterized membrane protein YkoI